MPTSAEVAQQRLDALTSLPDDTHPYSAGRRTAVEEYLSTGSWRYPHFQGATLYAAARKRLSYAADPELAPRDYRRDLTFKDRELHIIIEFCEGYQSLKPDDTLDFLWSLVRTDRPDEGAYTGHFSRPTRPDFPITLQQATDLYFFWRADWGRRHPVGL